MSNPKDPEDAVVINEFIDAERNRCEILLFEAEHVAKGPIVRLGLRHKIHLGFHNSFHQDWVRRISTRFARSCGGKTVNADCEIPLEFTQ